MGFTPTFDNLSEREPLKAEHYNTLVDDLQAALTEIDGTELAAPLTLSRSGQNLNGGQHNIYGFKKWLGNGNADVCIRDVTGYGATGDGSTDDTAGIQAAIDDCGVNGGCVFFPPGIYKISSPILPAGSSWNKSKVTLMGSGFATEIKLANASNCRAIQIGHVGQDIDGITLNGLKINGNSANQTVPVPLIDMAGSVGARIINCWINDGGRDGVDIGDATDLLIQDSRIDYNTGNGITSSVATGTRVIIDSCQIVGNTWSGVYLLSSPPDTIISNNTMTANGINGILIETSPNAAAARFVIDGNTISLSGTSSLSDGIRIRSKYADVTARDFVISGNIITDSGRHGIMLDAHPGQIRGWNLSGNIVKTSKTHGIYVSADCLYGVISGNTCNDNGQVSANSVGIYLFGEAAAAAPGYVSITANNCCDDQSTVTQDYGIWLGTYSHHCPCLANVAVANATAQIIDDSTSNDVSHNVG